MNVAGKDSTGSEYYPIRPIMSPHRGANSPGCRAVLIATMEMMKESRSERRWPATHCDYSNPDLIGAFTRAYCYRTQGLPYLNITKS